jgi:transcription elongation factor Elf1
MIFPFYKFNCPGCGNPIEFHERLSGGKTNCPSCGKNIEIPAPREAKGKNTWGNWSKGVFLGTSVVISLLIILLLVSFFLKGS